jgi:hypothetical protein
MIAHTGMSWCALVLSSSLSLILVSPLTFTSGVSRDESTKRSSLEPCNEPDYFKA